MNIFKTKQKIICIFLLLSLLSSELIFAQRNNIGISSGVILKLIGSVYTNGLAQAGVGGLSDNVAFTNINPSVVNKLKKKFQIITSFSEYFSDINYGYIGLNLPTKLTNIGINILYLYKNNIKALLANGEEAGRFSINNAVVGISFGKEYTQLVDTGITIKYFQERLERESSRNFALDFGIIYKNFLGLDNMNAGMVLRNIGSGIKFIDKTSSLPLDISFGLYYKLWEDTVALLFDLEQPMDDALGIKTAIRFKLSDELTLLFGYNSNKDIGLPLTIGLSINLKNMSFCCSYESFEELGNAIRGGISLF